jgi:hypothetical protein
MLARGRTRRSLCCQPEHLAVSAGPAVNRQAGSDGWLVDATTPARVILSRKLAKGGSELNSTETTERPEPWGATRIRGLATAIGTGGRAKIAVHCGVSEGTVAGWAMGDRRPAPQYVPRLDSLSRALQTS